MANRWWTYQRERFPILAHGILIASFSFSAVCFSSLLRGQTELPRLSSIFVAFVTAFLFFLQLRIADEFKDFEEDARYRPYRAVPRGLVTLRELGGLGAMCAIELVKDVAGGEPSPQLTQALMKVANEKGLILLSCGTYGNVIRFLVPLTASDQIVRDGMDIFEASLTEAVTGVA